MNKELRIKPFVVSSDAIGRRADSWRRLRQSLVTVIVVSCLLLVVAPMALAQNLSSQVLSLTIVNPDGPMSQVRAVFNIPTGFIPGDYGRSVKWDAVSRQLSVDLGVFAPGESKPINITLSAPAGAYTITGKTTGFWDQVSRPFSADLRPIILVFKIPAAGLASLPKQIGAIPEEQRADTFVADLAKDIGISEQVVRRAETISLPVAAGLGAVGVVSVFSTLYSASANFAAGISRLLSYVGFGLVRFRKKKPWGRVLNHLTGRPVEGAFVKLLDTGFRRVKETQITDKDGRFEFLAVPGEYLIRVDREGFGEKETAPFSVIGPDQVLNLEITMEALKTTLSDYAGGLMRLWQLFNYFLDKINPLILVFGTLAAVISVLLNYSVLNFVLLGLYVFLIALSIVLHKIYLRSYGRVLSRSDSAPVALAVVRVYDIKQNWLLGTKVTDQLGRFNFLINPGEYYFTAAKDRFAPFQSRPEHFSKAAVVNVDIKLEQARQ